MPTVSVRTAALRTGLGRVTAALNHDFCPGANRWVYWLKRPLWLLVLAGAAATLCALFVNSNAWIAVGAVAAVIVLGVCWPWITIRGLSGTIAFDRDRVREGQPVRVTLSIRNGWPWPAWGLTLAGGLDGEPTSEPRISGPALARVAAWSQSEFDWEFRPDRRGRYPLEAPGLQTGFPFGLRSCRRPVAVREPLIVWPQTTMLDSSPDGSDARPSDDRYSERRAGDFGDLLGTRAYRPGDLLRRVHWPQTARHGRLIVCDRQAPARISATVVVDLDAAVHSGSGRHSTLETAIRVAASVCESLQRQHARVECWLGSEWLSLTGGRSKLRRLFDALADVPPAGLASPAVVCVSRLAASGRLCLVVTTEAGMARWRSLAGSPAAVRWIVVEAPPTFDGQPGAPTPVASDVWLRVASGPEWVSQLPQLWRRACHAG